MSLHFGVFGCSSLQQLQPKLSSNINGLKRKVFVMANSDVTSHVNATHASMSSSHDGSATSKKLKKLATKVAKNNNSQTFDPNDQAALNRRAERFQREHEIERQKGLNMASAGGTNGGQASHKTNYQNAHLFNERLTSRAASPSAFGSVDDPEADPVCYSWSYFFG
jgi:hypothetical protein